MTAPNGSAMDLIRRTLPPAGVVAFYRGRALEAMTQPVSAAALRESSGLLAAAALTQCAIEDEARRAREARAMRAVVRRYWREQMETYRLMAVIFGEDRGKVRHRRRHAMTYGEAAMFAYFMAASA